MILTYSTIPRSSTGFGNLWLAGTFKLIQGCEAAAVVLVCPCRTLSPAEALAELVLLQLCGVGVSQESRAQPVCSGRRGEQLPETPQWYTGGWGWAGHVWCPITAPVWQPGGGGALRCWCWVRSWAWRLLSQKQKLTLLCSKGDCTWDLPFLQGELLAPLKAVLELDLAELGFLFLGFTSSLHGNNLARGQFISKEGFYSFTWSTKTSVITAGN